MANPQKTIYVALFDGMGKAKINPDGSRTFSVGHTYMFNGGSQANAVPIFTGSRNIRTLSNMVNHELGHTAGLDHVWEAKSTKDARVDIHQIKQGSHVTDNLMNSEANPTEQDRPSENGDVNFENTKIVTDGQKKDVIETVENEQN